MVPQESVCKFLSSSCAQYEVTFTDLNEVFDEKVRIQLTAIFIATQIHEENKFKYYKDKLSTQWAVLVMLILLSNHYTLLHS